MVNDPISCLFRLFADLLAYPTTGLASQTVDCIDYLEVVQGDASKKLVEFSQSLQDCSLARLEELYSSTFDLQPVCHPYVGYQLFGESYKRGAFMASLVEGYRSFEFSAGMELPDHVAVVLHFLSLSQEAREDEFGRTLLLEGLLPAVKKMAAVLEGQVGNPYSAVISALLLFLEAVKERVNIHA